ncbi:MAG: hypothetical protein AB7P04_12310 [Bacteriovoracia bacterium]
MSIFKKLLVFTQILGCVTAAGLTAGCGQVKLYNAQRQLANLQQNRPDASLEEEFRQIMDKRCTNCHRAGGSVPTSPLDRSVTLQAMTDSGMIFPGNAPRSKVFNRLIGAGGLNPTLENMPMGSGALPYAEMVTIRQFIESLGDPSLVPQLDWISPAVGQRSTNQLTMPFVVSCTRGFPVSVTGPDIAPIQTDCPPGGQISGTLMFTHGGTYPAAISAKQRVYSLNLQSDISIAFDNVAPVVTTDFQANQQVLASVTAAGNCTTGDSQVKIQIIGGAMFLGNCAAGRYSIPVTFTAPDGNKDLEITQTDALQNQGRVTIRLVRNTAVPLVTITQPVNGLRTRVANQQVRGACDQATVRVISSRIMGSPQAGNCVNGTYNVPVTFLSPDGPVDIRVESTNSPGTVGFALGSYFLDTTPPAVVVQAPLSGATVPTTTVAFDVLCESGRNVDLSSSNSGLVTPNVVLCPATGRAQFNVTLSSIPGAKNIQVAQTDEAQNVTQIPLTINYQPPPAQMLAILSPVTGTSFNQVSIPAQIRCSTNAGDGNVTVSGTRITSLSAVCPTGGVWSVNLTAQPGEYQNSPINAAQTISGTGQNVSVQFSMDTTPPSLTTTLVNGQRVQRTINVQGTCSENGRAVTVSGDLMNTINTSCSNGSYTAAVTLSGSDGNKYLSIEHRDAATNPTVITRQVILDTIPPVLTIASPAPGSIVSSASITVTGTCETGLTVSLAGNINAAPQTTTCAAGTFSKAVALSGGDGPKQINAFSVDGANNRTDVNLNLTLDASAPNVVITTPVEGSYQNTAAVSITGTCESPIPVVISGGLTQTYSAACNGNTFSQVATLSGGDGPKTITARQTDGANNVGQNSVTVNLDTLNPVFVITFPANNGDVAPPTLTVTGTCENGNLLTVTAAGTSGSVTCAGGAFSRAFDISAIPFGFYQLSVTARDQALNMSSQTIPYFRLPNNPTSPFGKAQRVMGRYCMGCHMEMATNTEAQYVAPRVIPGNPNQSTLTMRTRFSPTGGASSTMPLNPTLYNAFTQSDYNDLANWITNYSGGGSGGSGGGGTGTTVATVPGEKLILMDRFALKSKLSNIYGIATGSAYGNGLNPADRLLAQVSIFGGPCDATNISYSSAVANGNVMETALALDSGKCGYQDSYPGRYSIVDNEDRRAATRPISFPPREGFRIKSCWDIGYKDGESVFNDYLKNAISNATGVAVASIANHVNTNPVPNDAEIRAAYEMFYPQGDLPTAALDKLKTVATQANSRFGSTRKWEAWRYLLTTLCLSPEWQAQ